MSVLNAFDAPTPVIRKLTPGKDTFPPVPEIASARAKRLYEEVAELEQAAREANRKAYDLTGSLAAVRVADAQAAGAAHRQFVDPPEREEERIKTEIEEAKRQAEAWQSAAA
jgi:hypothetical protein